ncbi:hypothetical protein [Rhodoferax sp.]|uniref:hypothetical protein n=1 Tax=Rhodoferax sp. TaxID=50421 RepID=UPI002ACF03A0|nr:hypothetical protein [Rhodoferax sp.]MDZ7919172.1 hypothetical protein [Rhodoferax sp.]
MLHPLFHLIATQPQLLGDHAQAYGELLGSELTSQATQLKRRTLLGALGLCLMGVALVLAGVALMLWVTLAPAPTPGTLWVLVLVPGIPALMSVLCGWLLRAPGSFAEPAFGELRRQVQADVALLRSLST